MLASAGAIPWEPDAAGLWGAASALGGRVLGVLGHPSNDVARRQRGHVEIADKDEVTQTKGLAHHHLGEGCLEPIAVSLAPRRTRVAHRNGKVTEVRKKNCFRACTRASYCSPNNCHCPLRRPSGSNSWPPHSIRAALHVQS